MGKGRTAGLEAREALAPAFAQRALAEPIPKWKLPEREMPARTAQQLIEDERGQDANPRRNLASFVTTWMEPEAALPLGGLRGSPGPLAFGFRKQVAPLPY